MTKSAVILEYAPGSNPPWISSKQLVQKIKSTRATTMIQKREKPAQDLCKENHKENNEEMKKNTKS